MVQLKFAIDVDVSAEKSFQFLYGTIKIYCFSLHCLSLASFNSSMVQLKSGFKGNDLQKFLFQFLYGTIKIRH